MERGVHRDVNVRAKNGDLRNLRNYGTCVDPLLRLQLMTDRDCTTARSTVFLCSVPTRLIVSRLSNPLVRVTLRGAVVTLHLLKSPKLLSESRKRYDFDVSEYRVISETE